MNMTAQTNNSSLLITKSANQNGNATGLEMDAKVMMQERMRILSIV
jgi:hypothetical protein